ncbi:hydrogen peroxide-inducible genes activator [Bdellovibrio bacteriovorus]|uniref:Redox-sensitive transcriptional activator n=1 Tax=Bdellovibrio bacteriovorus (strain ATCC 15356 / DSM 50701 / NCIMB 9529 / HD100) TaxID=264462 RepID=Q6MK93_BDEBA|nr:hydrogen peroxide-inducible genes activator [Bdellovibrio bacteriovorus]AHZ85023.1 transcriptional regulator [Bdellovibrio bacteriovorus]BEV68910.1 Hydrogen peroxide-inducible genes activator [Bdellovibrio bacteriovorus]CAE80316.1 Redox-sensitive transcriptional activator [Bdellovibrio bacteriovorus HD100]
MSPKVNFSLTQLEYVMAVHKYGHFAKAAEACHVTQPTLSMQIQKLEEDLGVVIFDRSKKPILLTHMGKKLISQIQTVLFESRKIESIIQHEQKGAKQGVLSIGVIPTVAPYLLPRLLPVVEEMFPGVDLNIKEMQTDQILEALNGDDIDVGVLATPTLMPKMFEFPLYYEPFYVLCEKNHEYAHMKKIKYQSLGMEDIWLLEEGHCLRNQVLDICSVKKGKGQGRRYKFESGSLETLKNLVDLYGGYTLLPHLATEQVGARSHLVPFERPIPAREIGLVYRREHYKNELIEALGEAILKSIPEELRKIRPKDLDVLPIA